MSGRSSGGESLMKSVNEKCESVPFLKRLSAQLGVKPALVVFAGLSFLVPFVVFGIFTFFLSRLLTYWLLSSATTHRNRLYGKSVLLLLHYDFQLADK